MLVMLGLKLASTLLLQGEKYEVRPNGWHVVFWLLWVGIAFAAGGFSLIFGIPSLGA